MTSVIKIRSLMFIYFVTMYKTNEVDHVYTCNYEANGNVADFL